METPDGKISKGGGGFGGLRSSPSILGFGALSGLLALAFALLPGPLGLHDLGEDPEVSASRSALTGLELAQRTLADPTIPAELRIERTRDALGQTAGALSVLAIPTQRWPLASLAFGLLGLGLGLAALASWHRRRWDGPMARSEALVWQHIHGGGELRLDEDRGGREARALARLLNALAEHRARRVQAEEEGTQAALAELRDRLKALGQGDLSGEPLRAAGELAPLSSAFEEARSGLADRVRSIHGEASALAEGAAGMAKATRRMAVAQTEQREALARLSDSAATSEKELKDAERRLGEGLSALHGFSKELQRSAQQHRAELSVATRRLDELRRILDELAGAELRLKAVEECLALLDEFRREPAESTGAGEGAKVLSTRAALALRRGREAVEGLRRDLQRLRSDTAQVTATLAETSRGAPPTVAELEPGVIRSLQESGLLLLRIEERLMEALRALERSAGELAGGATELSELQLRAQGAGPRLAHAIAGLRLSGYLEQEVLEHLRRLEADLVVAEESGLSPMGEAGMRAILEASKTSRARLGRLVAQTEAALDIVRGA